LKGAIGGRDKKKKRGGVGGKKDGQNLHNTEPRAWRGTHGRNISPGKREIGGKWAKPFGGTRGPKAKTFSVGNTSARLGQTEKPPASGGDAKTVVLQGSAKEGEVSFSAENRLIFGKKK